MTDWQPESGTNYSSPPATVTGGAAMTFPGERRRTPRFAAQRPTQVELSVVIEFQVLELSEIGVLLLCEGEFGIGDGTQVHTLLAREPFSACIEVKRVREIQAQSAHGPKRYLVSAAFVSLDDKNTRRLRQFIPQRLLVTSSGREH
jgi:hypothetical protein